MHQVLCFEPANPCESNSRDKTLTVSYAAWGMHTCFMLGNEGVCVHDL